MAEDNDDLDDSEGEGSDSSESSQSGEVNRKKIIMILLPMLLVVGAAVGVYFSGVVDKMFDSSTTGEEKAATVAEEASFEREVKETVFYDLPELIVNLNAQSRKQGSLLRLKISLEIEDPADINQIEKYLPRVTDTFLVHMREVHPEELDGSAGVQRLKEELLLRVNRAVKPAKVYDIRFKQFEIH